MPRQKGQKALRPFNHGKVTNSVKRQILKQLEKTGNLRGSCAKFGVSEQTWFYHIKKDPVLKEMYDAAKGKALNRLTEVAHDRAINGTDKPVYYKGELVGHEKIYDNRLLETLLRAHDPDTYANKSQVQIDQHITIGDLS